MRPLPRRAQRALPGGRLASSDAEDDIGATAAMEKQQLLTIIADTFSDRRTVAHLVVSGHRAAFCAACPKKLASVRVLDDLNRSAALVLLELFGRIRSLELHGGWI